MTSYLEFMNAARGTRRPQCVRDRGGRAELHACGRKARDLAVSAEPHHNRLEERVGVRLLTRTTRNVAPTEAGERMLRALGPALDTIAEALASARELREKPAGTIRITTSEHAAHAVLWPALEKLLPNYPDVHVELVIESGFTDIVTERFDAGVRLGESIAKDMVAVRIGPDMRMAVVGSPAYFATTPKPRTPQDLAQHKCINLRLSTAGGLDRNPSERVGRRQGAGPLHLVVRETEFCGQRLAADFRR